MSGGPVATTEWIFGYGSLLWRPAFAYTERRAAGIAGWRRRFWQGSTDHRGRPGAPGRVVTLVAARDAVCAGVAYRLEPGRRGEVLAGLDRREQGGYKRLPVDIELHGGGLVSGCTYVAGPSNPNYLGPAPLVDIAAQIRFASGPSGRNDEYALRLAAALREIGVRDEHVFAVEAILALAEAGARPDEAP